VEDMGSAPVLSVVEVYAPMLALPTPNLAQPLDTGEKKHPLLAVYQLVAITLFGFPEDLAADLVTKTATKYPVFGHEVLPFVVRALGSCSSAVAAPPGLLSYLRLYCTTAVSLVSTSCDEFVVKCDRR
jgi:hypothetical protein